MHGNSQLTSAICFSFFFSKLRKSCSDMFAVLVFSDFPPAPCSASSMPGSRLESSLAKSPTVENRAARGS